MRQVYGGLTTMSDRGFNVSGVDGMYATIEPVEGAAIEKGLTHLMDYGVITVVLALVLFALWKIGRALGSKALEAFTALFNKQLEQGDRALHRAEMMEKELKGLTAATRHSDEQNVAALNALRESLDRSLAAVNHRLDAHDAKLNEVDRRVLHLELVRDGSASGVRRIPTAVDQG